jgi:hypothetical protein
MYYINNTKKYGIVSCKSYFWVGQCGRWGGEVFIRVFAGDEGTISPDSPLRHTKMAPIRAGWRSTPPVVWLFAQHWVRWRSPTLFLAFAQHWRCWAFIDPKPCRKTEVYWLLAWVGNRWENKSMLKFAHYI